MNLLRDKFAAREGECYTSLELEQNPLKVEGLTPLRPQ
jgi:hypothetical protein